MNVLHSLSHQTGDGNANQQVSQVSQVSQLGQLGHMQFIHERHDNLSEGRRPPLQAEPSQQVVPPEMVHGTSCFAQADATPVV